MNATDGKTNEQIQASAELARRNIERLKAQKAAPLPLMPLHSDDADRRGSRKRAAASAAGAMTDRRRREATRELTPYLAASSLGNSLSDVWPSKPAEECESLLDP